VPLHAWPRIAVLPLSHRCSTFPALCPLSAMLPSRVRLASAGQPTHSAWEAFKTKFKSKFMIGDTHEHYIPPRPGFQNRPTQFAEKEGEFGAFRLPAPGSQPTVNVPRGYPETEYDISLAKRASLKLTPGAGMTVSEALAEKEQLPGVSPTGVRFLPRHVPQPAWVYQRDQLKRARRLYLETGQYVFGVPYKALGHETYYPVQQHQTREEWEKVEVIRDVRVPRL